MSTQHNNTEATVPEQEKNAAGEIPVQTAENSAGADMGEKDSTVGRDNSEEQAAEHTDGLAEDSFMEGEDMDFSDEGAEQAGKIAELEAEAAELRSQVADTRDQLLRKAADFENFRKRMNQEKQNAIDYANQSLLLDIIPVIDDFERAIQSAETSTELAELPAGKAMLDGITMIEKRLVGQLENKWGLKRFNSAGEPFDPNFHEAMMMEKSAEVEDPVVAEDFIKGYTLKDRVIRAAKVKVLMPLNEGKETDSE